MIPRILKWTLTVLLVALLSLEVASMWYALTWARYDPSPFSEEYGLMAFACLQRGAVSVGKFTLLEYSDVYGYLDARAGFSCQPIQGKSYGCFYYSPPDFSWWSFSRAKGNWSMGEWRVPLAPVILALALPTACLWLTDIRRSRRRRTGRCRTCGYDLAGLPASENGKPTCPECGA